MSRILSWLALPFVALAMVVVPLFGGHLCPEEVIPMLAGAASLPFLGAPARALIARLRKRKPASVHCCNEDHRPAVALPVFDDQKHLFIVANRNAKPLPDIDLDEKCNFPGCTFPGVGPGHSHVPPPVDLGLVCSDGHVGCHGDDPYANTGKLCGCPNVKGLHEQRISCPKEG